jgi:hypothetical protein
MNLQEGHTACQLVHEPPLRMIDNNRLDAFFVYALPSIRQGMSFRWDRTSQNSKWWTYILGFVVRTVGMKGKRFGCRPGGWSSREKKLIVDTLTRPRVSRHRMSAHCWRLPDLSDPQL